MANPYQYGDEDPYSGIRDEEGNIKREAAPKKKERIITKEQMRKAGFDNLRDFLNAERGLKRRDGKAPSKPAAAPSKAETKPASMTGKERANEMQRLQNRGGTDRLGESAAGRVIQRLRNSSSKSESSSKRDSDLDGEMSDVIGAKKGGMMKAYKSGGMVKSSASRRADGCATKGKTKGRMV